MEEQLVKREQQFGGEGLFEEEIHLRDYWQVIKNRKNVVLTFFIITVVTVALYSFLATPVYEASTQILVEENQPPLSTGKIVFPTYDPEFFETQAQIIKSKNVALKVVELLNLDQTYESFFPKKERFSLKKAIITPIKEFFEGLLKEQDETDLKKAAKSKKEEIAEMIIANLEVSPVEESRILEIRFRSTNPEFAALVANTIAEAYKEEMMAIQMNTVGYAIKWMTKKADEIKKRLAQSEHTLQEFMKKNDIVTIKDRIMIQPQKLADLSAKLSQAIAERKELEAIYNKVVNLKQSGGNLETIPDIATNKNIQEINTEILKSEQQIAQLSQKYGKKHPVMKKALSDLRALRIKKYRELRTIVALIKNQYELAKMKEKNLKRALDEAKSEVQDLNEKFIQYGILKRDVDTNRALYEALVISMKEKGITEESQRVNVWVTNKADIPETPVKPKIARNILLAMVLGLFGGVGLAFFLEYLDNTITDPERVQKRLGLSTLGIIERLELDDPKEVYKGILRHSQSAFAEGFRAIRAALLLSSAGQVPDKVLITSVNPSEGKTTASTNLSMALALANHKVLLIDADMRKPMVHKVLGIENSKGLSTYLAGLDDKPNIKKLDELSLYILPSGPIPPNPSELLSSAKMEDLLTKALKQFEIIILDSAPILSASDAIVLSKLASGTIIVGKAGATTFDDLSKGLEHLKKVNAKILGMIVNDVDPEKHPYYYSYYKGYYAYYGDEAKGKSDKA